MLKFARSPFKSLKISVTFMLVLVTFLLALMSFAISTFYSQQVIFSLVQRLETDINGRVNVELDRLFDNAERITRINWAMLKDELAVSKDSESIGRQLLNIIRADDSVDFAYYANELGGTVIAGRETIGYSVLTTQNFLPGPFVAKTYDIYGILSEEKVRNDSYFDARTREWYKKSFLATDVYWSNIYAWVQEPTLGITVSKSFFNKDGSKGGVFACDLRLSKIGDFLKRLYISPNGYMYLVQDNGLLIATTKGDEAYVANSGRRERIYAHSSKNLLIREAQTLVEKEVGPLSRIKSAQSFRLNILGQVHYVMIEPYVFKNVNWYKVLVIPISDFDRQISEFKQRYLLLALVFLCLSLLIGILMARRIIKPIVEITRASEKFAAGVYDYRIDSGRRDEIGRLEVAFNTMADDIKQLLDSLGNKNRELVVFNQKLERMVVERTKDLEVRAMTDEMTGILNHKSLKDKLEGLYQRKIRDGFTFSIVMIDLDYFKKINDTHGHLVGDGILKEFSQLIRNAIREGDVLGRYGGEEFMIIFPGAPLMEVVTICERLREMVAENDFLEQKLKITASFGVAESDGDGVEALIGRADQHLYDAKHAGRNRVVY